MDNKAHGQFADLKKEERIDLITGVMFSQISSQHDSEAVLGRGMFKLVRPFMGKEYEITFTVSEVE